MPPPVRNRYNAKARGSTAGGASHKKRKRGGGAIPENERDEGYAEDDGGQEEKGSRREELRSKLDIPDDTPISSKKRKRLDNYITKKLKAESRLESLALLKTHALPTSSFALKLASTSTLFQNPSKPLSATEKAEKREDMDVRRALSRKGGLGMMDDDDESEEEVETKEGRRKEKLDRNGRVEVVSEQGRVDEPMTMIEDVTKKKGKRTVGKKAAWSNLISTQPIQSSSSEFDSSDSANDSSSDEEKEDVKMQLAESSKAAAERERERTRSPTPKGKEVDRSTQVVEKEKMAQTDSVIGVGSSLKRGADGQVIQPRVVSRRDKHGVSLGFKYANRLKTYLLGRIQFQPRITATERRRIHKELREAEAAELAAMEAEADEDGGEEDYDEDDDDESDVEGTDSDEDMDDDEEEETGDEDDEAEMKPVPEEQHPPKPKLGFKDWALKQMGAVTAPNLLEQEPQFSHVKTERPNLPHVGPLGANFTIPKTSLLQRGGDAALKKEDALTNKARPIIKRRPSVDEARQSLPIVAEEQSIVEAINLHPVVVICGETGSGKTTGVPQMLYEAGYGFPGSDNPGMIAVTQPRRVAAVSLAIRVADELNLPKNSSLVAHQIRYSSTTSPDTAIKFLTDGVLLRELAGDFLLRRYSVVIVDEAHERGVNTDVLIGVLSRVAKLREKMWRERKEDIKPLRIVIMSATLRVSDFSENKTLFSTPPPVLNIAARQHPVTVHFNRRTIGDYVTEAYKKVVKIHARLPPGGILVFMTGQGEIQALCRKLEKKFGKKALEEKRRMQAAKGIPAKLQDEAARRWEEGEDIKSDSLADAKIAKDTVLEVEDLDIGDADADDLAGDVDDGAADEDPDALDSDVEDNDGLLDELGLDKEESDMPLHILPLYSLLSNEQQLKVFQPPPPNSRLVVVATNVAETSLTIPGIKYVVDTGRAKERQYDVASGVQTFRVSWISKASASQRAGRAGRTGPGHCYRLYSSAVFENHFEQFSQPEILRMPIEGIVLQMKSMNIDAVVNFPFPTPPDRMGLKAAESLLTHLGALEPVTSTRMVGGVERKGTLGGKITDLGKAMASFPVTPRFAKMLVIGTQHGCLAFVIAMVAALSVGDPFLREDALGLAPEEKEGEEDEALEEAVPEIGHIKSVDLRAKEERKAKRKAFYQSQAQFAALGGSQSDTFKLLSVIGASEHEASLEAFCMRHFLRIKAMKEIHQLRAQISAIAGAVLPSAGIKAGQKMHQPSMKQLKVLRQIICAAFIDQIAIRTDLVSKSAARGNVYATTKGVGYRAMTLGGAEDVFIHPGSVMASSEPPEWVCYGEVVRSAISGKVWLRNLTKINPTWLSSLGKTLCTFSRPLELPSQAVQSRVATANTNGGNGNEKEGDERDVFVTPHFGPLGVELPAIKAKQRRVGGRWILQM